MKNFSWFSEKEKNVKKSKLNRKSYDLLHCDWFGVVGLFFSRPILATFTYIDIKLLLTINGYASYENIFYFRLISLFHKRMDLSKMPEQCYGLRSSYQCFPSHTSTLSQPESGLFGIFRTLVLPFNYIPYISTADQSAFYFYNWLSSQLIENDLRAK